MKEHSPFDILILAIKEGFIADLRHFVSTNRVPIILMARFHELGLMNEDGRPTQLAKDVTEENYKWSS